MWLKPKWYYVIPSKNPVSWNRSKDLREVLRVSRNPPTFLNFLSTMANFFPFSSLIFICTHLLDSAKYLLLQSTGPCSFCIECTSLRLILWLHLSSYLAISYKTKHMILQLHVPWYLKETANLGLHKNLHADAYSHFICSCQR